MNCFIVLFVCSFILGLFSFVSLAMPQLISFHFSSCDFFFHSVLLFLFSFPSPSSFSLLFFSLPPFLLSFFSVLWTACHRITKAKTEGQKKQNVSRNWMMYFYIFHFLIHLKLCKPFHDYSLLCILIFGIYFQSSPSQ